MRRTALAVILGAAVAISGCAPAPAPEPEAPVVAPADYAPVLSLNQMMVAIVDSHSHEIWDVVEKAPITDEEWEALEHASATLAAAGSLTMMSGNGPDDQRWPAEPDWRKYSQLLSDAGLAAVRAVAARDVQAVNAAGDQLVLSCIECHREYKLNVPRIWSDHEEAPRGAAQ